VVEGNICRRLVELLKHRSWRVAKPALRTIGNIVCAEEEVDYTQVSVIIILMVIIIIMSSSPA
jgi:hypothetical protein